MIMQDRRGIWNSSGALGRPRVATDAKRIGSSGWLGVGLLTDFAHFHCLLELRQSVRPSLRLAADAIPKWRQTWALWFDCSRFLQDPAKHFTSHWESMQSGGRAIRWEESNFFFFFWNRKEFWRGKYEMNARKLKPNPTTPSCNPSGITECSASSRECRRWFHLRCFGWALITH